MSISEFKASLTEENMNNIKGILAQTTNIKEEDFVTLRDYIEASVNALGEDQIAEPLRYLTASMGGLRDKDLHAVIGDDFNPQVFEEWNNLLGTPFFVYRDLPNCRLYDIPATRRARFRQEVGDNSLRSCASDLGYYMLEHLEPGDLVRDVQITHMLLDGGETAAVAEYVSQAEGEQLRLAANTLGQALRDAPDYVKDTIYDMPRCAGEKVDVIKLTKLLLTDCYAMTASVDHQKPIGERLCAVMDELVQVGKQELNVMRAICRLRMAQNARLRREEQEAQQSFVAAMNILMATIQQTDPATATNVDINNFWLGLKICQEMAQPKGIAIIFESIIKIEQAMTQDSNRSEEERGRVAEDIIAQHIDMAKLYYAFPKELQEQFTNYSEPAIALLNAFLDGEKQEKSAREQMSIDDQKKVASYYQSLGQICDNLGRHDDAYNALVEAQIMQMYIVGHYQKEEGDKMSQEALLQRLALSVTNHMLAGHYREKKSHHDLNVILTANLNMALDCVKVFPHDGRVMHFAINAALELGDYQHSTGGLMAECGTYQKVMLHLIALNNLRIDGQLCQDIATIHTKCGQAQVDDKIRRYSDGVRNLNIAHQLWSSLAKNTKDPNYQKNADFVAQLISKYKK